MYVRVRWKDEDCDEKCPNDTVMYWDSLFDSFMGTVVRPKERVQTDSNFAMGQPFIFLERRDGTNAWYPEKILTK